MKRAVFSLVSALAVAAAAAASETPNAPAAPVSTAARAIVVYEKPNFQGRALTLVSATPDLAPLNFNDQVASLVIQGTDDWVLCEHRNYAGRCVRVQARAEDLKLLQIGGRVSSLYPVPATPAALAPAPTTAAPSAKP